MKRIFALFGLSLIALNEAAAFAGYSFICKEPGGERLVQIDGNNVSLMGKSIALHIDDKFVLDAANGDRRLFYFEGDNVQPGASPTDAPVRVTIATFDGDDIRHGRGGEVMMNYRHPNLCPTSAANRVYSIEGDAIDRKQLVAGLYLLKPEMFSLTPTETDKQLAAIKEANAEQEKLDAADQVAGKWTMLNGNGIAEKLDKGTITVAPKKGDAYPVTFDFSAGGGPTWTGVGHYALVSGDKTFWVAYGTAKTAALCVYDINGGTLSGKWSPWYVDGDPKNTGTETLDGPPSLDGTFKITAAAAPTTGAAYTGSVTIKPMTVVGSSDDAKPYSLVWDFGKVKVYGIGIKTGNQLFVASGAGPDLCVAKFIINNGTMNCDWYKFGSTEKGGSAAMTAN